MLIKLIDDTIVTVKKKKSYYTKQLHVQAYIDKLRDEMYLLENNQLLMIIVSRYEHTKYNWCTMTKSKLISYVQESVNLDISNQCDVSYSLLYRTITTVLYTVADSNCAIYYLNSITFKRLLWNQQDLVINQLADM